MSEIRKIEDIRVGDFLQTSDEQDGDNLYEVKTVTDRRVTAKCFFGKLRGRKINLFKAPLKVSNATSQSKGT